MTGRFTGKELIGFDIFIDLIALGLLIYLFFSVKTLKKDNGYFWNAIKKLTPTKTPTIEKSE